MYRNEAVAGAGAYDDAIKKWIQDNEAALVGKLPPAPFTDPGPLLRLLVATMATSAGAASGSTTAAGATAPSGGGGGGSGGGRDGLLAEALDTTKLPSAKGEDGHEKVVPLPADFLSLIQAEALVPRRPLLEAALVLGQTAAGADACANLGVIQNVVDSETGEVTRVRQSDEALCIVLGDDPGHCDGDFGVAPQLTGARKIFRVVRNSNPEVRTARLPFQVVSCHPRSR